MNISPEYNLFISEGLTVNRLVGALVQQNVNQQTTNLQNKMSKFQMYFIK